MLDTGHFALEKEGERVAALIGEFMASKIRPAMQASN